MLRSFRVMAYTKPGRGQFQERRTVYFPGTRSLSRLSWPLFLQKSKFIIIHMIARTINKNYFHLLNGRNNFQALADFMSEYRQTRVSFDSNNLVLTAGATSANETLMFCLANPGDAFLLPTPYYPGLVQRLQACFILTMFASLIRNSFIIALNST